MSTTSPSSAIPTDQTPAGPEITKKPDRRWRWWPGLAGLLALLLTLPAWLDPQPDPTRQNLLTWLSGWRPVTDQPDFLAAWHEFARRLQAGQLPLYQFDRQQPLLEATNSPAFYPGSLLYYFGSNLALFYTAHLTLLAAGGFWLAARSRHSWLWMGAVSLVTLVAGTLRADWLAGLAWLPVVLLLAGWQRRRLSLILLPLPLGMIGLAGPQPLTLGLYALSLVWWFVQAYRRNAQGAELIRQLVLVGLAMVGGFCLAGPQLFPRLAYSGPAFDPAKPVVSQPLPVALQGAQLAAWQFRDNGDLTLRLLVPARTNRVEVLVTPAENGPNRGVQNWSSQLYRASGPTGEVAGKRGPEIKLNGQNERRLSFEFDAKSLPVDESRWIVQLHYLPQAFTLGGYLAFLVLLSQGMLVLVVGWVRFYREEASDHPLRRVVKNSATPLFAQLSGKVIDFTFALFVLRLLGPDGNGQWTFATTTWLFFATICDFGLESLVTREIARARQLPEAHAVINRLFVTKLLLRLGFSVAALPVALLWLALNNLSGSLTVGSFWAVVLLMIGFWPTSVVGSITVVFRGYEKFEFLAAGQLLVAILRVPLGMVVLLAGWGVVGLATVSIILNLISLVVLQNLMQRQVFRPRVRLRDFDPVFARKMLGQAFPLMLNGLIINVLFKSDGLVLQALRDNTELGVYNAAYKFVDALLIIPSTLTLALFPLFSAYGTEARENLLRAYHEGTRLLMLIALPITAGTVFVAYDLIGFLGGAEYLPGGALALQILIWFLPFSYFNGITQYVLIAIDQQRQITRAVIVAALANVILNLALIPLAGFVASAGLTILTELILLVPFTRILRRSLGPGSVRLWAVSWRPALATAAMMAGLGGLLLIGINHFIVTVVVGGAIYIVGLILTRAVTRQDLALLKKVVRR